MSSQQLNKNLRSFLYPYVFVLKEGKEFSTDCLDYSLFILQVGHPEVLPSPEKISHKLT